MSLNDNVKDVLECPVCYTVPRSGPIYQCNRGHIVCHECRPMLKICPQCKATLKHNVRSLIAEKMRDNVSIPCEFEGCAVEMQRQELEKHEKICVNRQVMCPAPRCSRMVVLTKLVDHVNNADALHSLSSFDFPLTSFPLANSRKIDWIMVDHYTYTRNSTYDWPCNKMFYNESYFFCRQRRNQQGLWFIWLYMLEDDNSKLNDYTCTISIIKRDEDGEFENKVSSVCRPISLDSNAESVEKSKDCLVFTDDIAKQFYTKKNSRWFNLEGVEFTVDIEETNPSTSSSRVSKKRKLNEGMD